VLPIAGPLLSWRKNLPKQLQTPLVEYIKVLTDLEVRPTIHEAFTAGDAKLMKTDFLAKGTNDNAIVHPILSLARFVYAVLQDNAGRFAKGAAVRSYVGYPVEDWIRGFVAVQYLSRRITAITETGGSKRHPAALMWGDPRASIEAAQGGGTDQATTGRTAQAVDNIVAADAIGRIQDEMAAEVAIAREARDPDAVADRTEVMASRREFESVTTALMSVQGYPQGEAKSEEVGRINYAPPLTRQDIDGVIATLNLRVRVVSTFGDGRAAPTIDELVARSNDLGSEIAAMERNAALINAEVEGGHDELEKAIEEEGRDLVDNQRSDAIARKVLSEASVLSGDAGGIPRMSFLDTMKHLGWDDLLDEYYETGRVKVCKKSKFKQCRDFGLTPGQVAGEYFPFSLVPSKALLRTRGRFPLPPGGAGGP
jgi:hypothetical protein